MKNINILYTTDMAYFPHMITFLYSLLDNTSMTIHIIMGVLVKKK